MERTQSQPRGEREEGGEKGGRTGGGRKVEESAGVSRAILRPSLENYIEEMKKKRPKKLHNLKPFPSRSNVKYEPKPQEESSSSSQTPSLTFTSSRLASHRISSHASHPNTPRRHTPLSASHVNELVSGSKRRREVFFNSTRGVD